jgi:hypothetical protein
VSVARYHVRELERFAYRAVADAEAEQDVREARVLLRLSVGLRRKLDLFKS